MKVVGWVSIALGFVLLGCTTGGPAGDSGQTGSTSCALPCRCGYLTGFVLAKATVLEVEQHDVTIQVEQLLNASPEAAHYDKDEITGSYEQPPLCNGPEPALPQVGAEVFAAFADDYYSDEHLVLRTQPWGDQYQLMDGTAVSLTETLRLAYGQNCPQAYAPPCNDTR